MNVQFTGMTTCNPGLFPDMNTAQRYFLIMRSSLQITVVAAGPKKMQ